MRALGRAVGCHAVLETTAAAAMLRRIGGREVQAPLQAALGGATSRSSERRQGSFQFRAALHCHSTRGGSQAPRITPRRLNGARVSAWTKTAAVTACPQPGRPSPRPPGPGATAAPRSGSPTAVRRLCPRAPPHLPPPATPSSTCCSSSWRRWCTRCSLCASCTPPSCLSGSACTASRYGAPATPNSTPTFPASWAACGWVLCAAGALAGLAGKAWHLAFSPCTVGMRA